MQNLFDSMNEPSLRFEADMKPRKLPSLTSPLTCFLLFVISLFGTPASSSAQGFGKIVGSVSDKDGGAVPGARVTAVQTQTGTKTETLTNGSGDYVFPSLPPAGYSVTVEAQGFSALTDSNITLLADQSQTVNISLSVGTLSQSIEVSTATPQVDTTTGTISQVVTEKQVNELPLNGRNAAALTTLTPGVVQAPSGAADQGNTKTFPVAVTISANGARANQTSYLLDGGNNVDEYTNVNAPFPFPDALQEFSIQTSNYSAEYGQNAGAVVNVITKSGTGRYHGDLFEYVRNRIFNARNYFQTAVDPLKRNQFGGTIGGPVGLPQLWHSDSSFFFFGIQRTTLRTRTHLRRRRSRPRRTLPVTSLCLQGREASQIPSQELCIRSIRQRERPLLIPQTSTRHRLHS
jgi:carboxypeptidase family protein/TonB-dependent receptor-like protein